jgi:hypothetical protein
MHSRQIVGKMPLELKKRLIWSRWIFANGAGVLVGALAATALIPIIALLLMPFGAPDNQPFNIFFILALAACAFMGTAVGISQWFVLREIDQKIDARSWASATAIGTLLVGALVLYPEMLTASASMMAAFNTTAELSSPQIVATALFLGAFFGTIVGTAQWIVLKRHLAFASWWIASSALAGAITLPLMIFALAHAEAQSSYWGFWFIGTLSAAAQGGVYGGITGISLMALRAR